MVDAPHNLPAAAPIHWEHAACPACGSADEDEFLRTLGDGGAEFRLAKCRACETVFTNPRPTAASIGQFYSADYAPYQPRPVHDRNRFFARADRSLADAIPIPPGGSLLDYGCGSGRFAARMRERGWNASGMDFSEQAAQTARRAFGLSVIQGSLPHAAVSPASLDAITVREVLEHLHEPAATLRAMFDALKPGGYLYASVPNLAGWGFRAFGPAWSGLDVPRHLTHFTRSTLAGMLGQCGFEVFATRTKGHRNWTAHSVKRASELHPRGWSRFARSRLVQSALTTWTEWRGEADSLCILARKPAAEASRDSRAA